MTVPLRRSTSAHPASERSDAERERAWVAGIKAGDEAAFDAVFTTYYQLLCRYATSILGSADAAEDVVQSVFVAIWNFREAWELRRTLKLYLYTAVRNSAVQELRKRRTRQRLNDLHVRPDAMDAESDSPTWAADTSVEQAELLDSLERAVAALPPRGQQAYRLHRDHGLTYDEIADVMGISPKTVSVHIGRALLALRKALAAHLPPVILFAVLSLR